MKLGGKEENSVLASKAPLSDEHLSPELPLQLEEVQGTLLGQYLSRLLLSISGSYVGGSKGVKNLKHLQLEGDKSSVLLPWKPSSFFLTPRG